MHLHPIYHDSYMMEASIHPLYVTWVGKVQSETAFALKYKGSFDASLYNDGDEFRCLTEKESPPEIVYGDWEYWGERRYQDEGKPLVARAWHFVPYPVTWLVRCDLCGHLGEDYPKFPHQSLNAVVPNDSQWRYGDIFGRPIEHVCLNCLSRPNVTRALEHRRGELYALNLMYISRLNLRNRKARYIRCNTSERDIEIIEGMVAVRELRKDCDLFIKTIKEIQDAE